jgi:hypothetical protein
MKETIMVRKHARNLNRIAAIVLALGPISGGVAQGATVHSEIPVVALPAVNPCNGESVALSGPFDNIFHVNSTADGFHVSIHDDAKLTGTGSLGNSYILSALGGDEFDVATVDGAYVTPFHGVVVSTGAAPNYLLDGIDHWNVSGGVLNFLGFTVTATTCEG